MYPILSKAFHFISKTGIVGPHNGVETELLLAGKKPAGSYSPMSPAAELEILDAAVKEGRLIRHITTTSPRTQIYPMQAYYPKAMDKDLQRIRNSQNMNDHSTAFPLKYSGNVERNHAINAYKHECAKRDSFEQIPFQFAQKHAQKIWSNARVNFGLECLQMGEQKILLLAEQDVAALTPATQARLQQLCDTNTVCHSQIYASGPANNTHIFYGQPGTEDKMAELDQLMQSINAKGFDAESTARYGELMGYRPQDIAYFASDKPFLAYHTGNLRRALYQAALKLEIKGL